MNETFTQVTRRSVLEFAVRGAGLLGLGGVAGYLSVISFREGAWYIDTTKCVNSRLGATDAPACGRCATECVLGLSAIRAVNEYNECGRCFICPAYFDVSGPVDMYGVPSRKLCPRDAIGRSPIGEIDPDDPANNYYEYVIDNARCNGCGLCVKACKEPAGLGSIRLEVRHDLCVDCNRCSIAVACPDEAYIRGVTPPTRGRGIHV